MGAECWEQDGEHNGIVVYKFGIKGEMVAFYYLGYQCYTVSKEKRG